MTTLSSQGSKLLGAVQRNFQLLAELDKTHPSDVDTIVAAILAHIRSWRPIALHVDTRPVEKVEAPR